MTDSEKHEITEEPEAKKRRQSINMRKTQPLYYHSYLQLDSILNAQRLESAEHPQTGKSNDATAPPPGGRDAAAKKGCPFAAMANGKLQGNLPTVLPKEVNDENKSGAHDEHLFIVIHQTYELWFKQILWEINSVRETLNVGESGVPEKEVGKCVHRLLRVSEILKVLVGQLTVLETMTPLGFLDFRDFLFPASGFQSVQFRQIENALGLADEMRMNYGSRHYCSYVSDAHANEITAVTKALPSLHDLIQKWLERTPFLEDNANLNTTLQGKKMHFWDHYKKAVQNILNNEKAFIRGEADRTEEPQEKTAKKIEEVDSRAQHYNSVLEPETYEELKSKRRFRFSRKAMQAALFIALYQDEPLLQLAWRLLTACVDIDELLTTWRYRHSLMVHRMVGVKMGTGGSSGYGYLRATAQQHRVFLDLFNLSTYLIPRYELPPLPESVAESLHFGHDQVKNEDKNSERQ